LRKLLVECAWVMLRYNAWARSVYQRLTRGGTARKKRAIVALARKLLVRCWAMLRDDTPWREPAAAGQATAECHRPGRLSEGSRSRTRGPPASARSGVDPGDRPLSPKDVRTKGRRGVYRFLGRHASPGQVPQLE
jgi:hypothetical protein